MDLSPLINIHCLQINIYGTASASSMLSNVFCLFSHTKPYLISHLIIIGAISAADCRTGIYLKVICDEVDGVINYLVRVSKWIVMLMLLDIIKSNDEM